MAEQLFDAGFLRRLEYLKLVARQHTHSGVAGEHPSPKRGSSLEFAEYRHYQAGDDCRYIDWHVFSRLERLVVKLFSAEEDLTLHLLIDTSGSMGVGTPTTKLAYACKVAVALAYIGLASHDRISLATFHGRLERGPAPKSNRQHIFTLMDYCGRLQATGTTAFSETLAAYARQCQSQSPGRKGSRTAGLAIILSDLLDGAGSAAGLQALRAKRFDLVLIQVLDPQELEPPPGGPLLLRDLESPRSRRVELDAALLMAYEDRLQTYLRNLERSCLRHGIEYLRTSTSVPVEDFILRYLRRGLHLRS